MGYTQQQAEKINKTSIEVAEKRTDAIQEYSEVLSKDSIKNYTGVMGKLPYVDESGDLVYLDPFELLLKHAPSKISPELKTIIDAIFE